jgi:seryl-tRNA(Sec) selenium transferase
MVHAVGVVPPVGTVIVFAPLERVLTSTDPALAALEAALRAFVPTTSPLKAMVMTRVAATLIIYPQKSPVIVDGFSSYGFSIRRMRSMAIRISSGSLEMSRFCSDATATLGSSGQVMTA